MDTVLSTMPYGPTCSCQTLKAYELVTEQPVFPLSLQLCCCSVSQLCLTLCEPMDCSTPGFPVLHHLLEFAQTHVHWVSDAIPPSQPLLPPSSPALYLSQHQSFPMSWLFASGGLNIGTEIQLQHQSFQWIFRVSHLSQQKVFAFYLISKKWAKLS